MEMALKISWEFMALYVSDGSRSIFWVDIYCVGELEMEQAVLVVSDRF
jgi:hypothetical protein